MLFFMVQNKLSYANLEHIPLFSSLFLHNPPHHMPHASSFLNNFNTLSRVFSAFFLKGKAGEWVGSIVKNRISLLKMCPLCSRNSAFLQGSWEDLGKIRWLLTIKGRKRVSAHETGMILHSTITLSLIPRLCFSQISVIVLGHTARKGENSVLSHIVGYLSVHVVLQKTTVPSFL